MYGKMKHESVIFLEKCIYRVYIKSVYTPNLSMWTFFSDSYTLNKLLCQC